MQPRYGRQERLLGAISRVLFAPFMKLDLPARGSLPTARPLLLAGNHRSLLDLFVAAMACFSLQTQCRFMVQARYFELPGVGSILRAVGCIPLNAVTKASAFAEAVGTLEAGELVAIMPEGRLVPPDDRVLEVGIGRPGVSELASAVGATVLPVAFFNTDAVWPRAGLPRPRLQRPRVGLRFGEPIQLPSDDHEANTRLIMSRISELLQTTNT